MTTLAVAGVGLYYALEPLIKNELSRGELRVALEAYSPESARLALYYPSRAQVSPALQAFVACEEFGQWTRASIAAVSSTTPTRACDFVAMHLEVRW